MKVIYGQRGQPVGSMAGDAIYAKTGEQTAFVHDGHIYKADNGTWIGCYVGGVVYNAHGAPQGFMDGCRKGLVPPPPRLGAMLPPRLTGLGKDVSQHPAKQIPDFLLESSSKSSNAFRDGYFV